MYSFRSVFHHMEVPVVASNYRHGVALGLFYSSAADIPLLSPVPTGGYMVLVLCAFPELPSSMGIGIPYRMCEFSSRWVSCCPMQIYISEKKLLSFRNCMMFLSLLFNISRMFSPGKSSSRRSVSFLHFSMMCCTVRRTLQDEHLGGSSFFIK